jgi:DHA1 family multidrug resistance protein-like MFS transporter
VKSRRLALYGVIAAVFVAGTGIGSVLPILPLYLRDRGASYSLIGIIVGAALVGRFVFQYPAGWLSDRLGRRGVMVGGLVVAGIAAAAFVLPVSILGLIGLRFIHGAAGGALRPGARAAVADLVPASERGVAYGWLSAADLSGLIVGPALGGVLVVLGREAVFIATGLLLILAAAVLAVTLTGSAAAQEAPSKRPVQGGGLVRRAVIGIGMLSISIGVVVGIYDVVWSLFMKSLHASDFQVGASFSLFALPFVAVTPLAGWASDRWDRRWLAVGSEAAVALIAPIYPALTSIPLVIAVGVVESACAAFAEPSMNAYLMDAVPASARGRATGMVGAAEGAAMAIASLVAGSLFAIGVGVPFYAICGFGLLFVVLAVPFLWSARIYRD